VPHGCHRWGLSARVMVDVQCRSHLPLPVSFTHLRPISSSCLQLSPRRSGGSPGR
jgi:hypothetical protein